MTRLSIASLAPLISFALLGCSGSEDGPMEDVGPPAGVGPGATSGYVYFTAQKVPGAPFQAFIAELDGGRLRDLSLLFDGETPIFHTHEQAASPDGRFLVAPSISGDQLHARIVDVGAGTVHVESLPFDSLQFRSHFSWSPDSSRLGYLWLNEVPGSNLRLYLPDSQQLLEPATTLARVTVPLRWSPTSSHFAVRSYDQTPASYAFDVIDRDGNGARNVVPPGLDHQNPWSDLSGMSLAVVPDQTDPATGDVTHALYEHDLWTSDVREITSGPDQLTGLTYSPDGEWLAWLASEDTGAFEPRRLYLADVAGAGVPVPVSSPLTPGDASPLRWSPSGDRLAWTSVPDPAAAVGVQLNLTDRAGQTRSVPLAGANVVRELVWSPDGDWLACLGSFGGPIYVLETRSGTAVEELVLGGLASSDYELAWTPDSQVLVWLNSGPGELSVGAWERGASLIARRIGLGAGAANGPVSRSILPTSDSSSVVWVQRNAAGVEGIAVTGLALPYETRILSSQSGELDLISVGRMEVR